jgi:hypothetical protein
MAAPPLPAGARRLVPHHRPEALTAEAAPGLLIPRLLEDGDAADLAWLAAAYGEERLAAWLAARGGRQLSARSRAFWELVLGLAAAPAAPAAADLWPL